MITIDSPLTAVVGDKATKRKRMTEGLGIHTVGDLLRHFPRRYVKAGELTRVAELHPGEMLTVVGEIVASELRPYRDRRSTWRGGRSWRRTTSAASGRRSRAPCRAGRPAGGCGGPGRC